MLYWLIDADWGPGPECVFKWKYPVYPGNRHQAAMSGQGDKDFNKPYFGDTQMRIVMEREQTFLEVTKMDDFML